MSTATLEDFSTRAEALLASLPPGEPLSVTHHGRMLGYFISTVAAEVSAAPRPLGCYSGLIEVPADFNDPLPEIEAALKEPLC
jgi:hypothetical protein